MAVAAEGARADAALTAGFSVSSSRLPVSVERPCAAGPVVQSRRAPPRASSPVEAVPVIKRVAPGVVPGRGCNCVSVTPIESPMTPAPSKTAEPSRFQSRSRTRGTGRQTRFRDTDTIPATPRWDLRKPPRIIRGDVNDIGVGRLNDDIRALRRLRFAAAWS
jgi:hypothetical protein